MSTKNNIYLEHANISVSNLDEGVRFFQTAFPEFKVRGGEPEGQKPWLHVGIDDTYVALNIRAGKDRPAPYSGLGINHIGFVVSDVESIATRLLKAGYTRSYPKQIHEFRIRDYFYDADGNDYEFIQYLSDRQEERNDYSS